jgi:hypothetical protein
VPIVANIHNILHGWRNLMLKGFLLFGGSADKSDSYSKSSIPLVVEILQPLVSGLHCIASPCFAHAMVTHSALTWMEPVSLKIYT